MQDRELDGTFPFLAAGSTEKACPQGLKLG
jgi:hypothetical protein